MLNTIMELMDCGWSTASKVCAAFTAACAVALIVMLCMAVALAIKIGVSYIQEKRIK